MKAFPGKRYIGDGVYAEFDGFEFVLTTEDGITVQNRIVLEPEHVQAFDRFVADCVAVAKSAPSSSTKYKCTNPACGEEYDDEPKWRSCGVCNCFCKPLGD